MVMTIKNKMKITKKVWATSTSMRKRMVPWKKAVMMKNKRNNSDKCSKSNK